MLLKVHGMTVRSVIRAGKNWCGFLVPDKVGQDDIMDNDYAGFYVELRSLEELADKVRWFKHERCNFYVGYGVRFFQYIPMKGHTNPEPKRISGYRSPH